MIIQAKPEDKHKKSKYGQKTGSVCAVTPLQTGPVFMIILFYIYFSAYLIRATPDCTAAFATADATASFTRGSNAAGII